MVPLRNAGLEKYPGLLLYYYRYYVPHRSTPPVSRHAVEPSRPTEAKVVKQNNGTFKSVSHPKQWSRVKNLKNFMGKFSQESDS
jgi:hypothetical protein